MSHRIARQLLITLSIFAVAACSPSTNETPSSSGGGKADGLSPTSIDEFRCQVVKVIDDNVLEEGLGSIYDVTPDGFFEVDGSSHEVSYRASEFSDHSSGMILSIGQHSIGLHSGDDELEVVSEEPEWNDDTEFFTVRGREVDSRLEYKVRIFTQNQLGYVFYSDPPECAEEALTQCEGACGESTTTIDDEVACQEECPGEVRAQCAENRSLAVVDCRIDAPEGLW